MSLTAAAAYAQIKNLENTGKITLPQPQATIEVGSIDLTTGGFEWAVPTLTQTTTPPPLQGAKPQPALNVVVGVIQTNAVDLVLKFNVTSLTAKATIVGAKSAVAAKVGARAISTSATKVATAATLAATSSGITITGFPTLSSTDDAILLDAGMACSVSLAQTAPNTNPAVSTFGVTITIPGHPGIGAQLIILRPPVLGMGAFTIPALPMTIVYAPPQGKQAKNTSTYTDMTSLTRTVSSSISTSENTKTVQAYSAADLVGKVASSIAAVAAVVGTGGAAGAAGAAGAGVFGSILTALTGGGSSDDSSGVEGAVSNAAGDVKDASTSLALVSDVLGAVDSTNPASSGTLTTQTDHSITLTVTDTSMFASKAGLGPGVGDRIVYMTNVKVVWVAVNGDVGINILGFEGIAAIAVQDLMAEQKSLASGGTAASGLDAATLAMLLNLDPFCIRKPSPLKAATTIAGPPLVGPPRFVSTSPFEVSGIGTGAAGDSYAVSYDLTTDDKTTTTNVQTTITDAKPGWTSVLFGAPNVETTTTMTFTNVQAVEIKSEDKTTNTVVFYSEDETDPYDVLFFYDVTFGTFLFASKGSSVLVGDPNVRVATLNPA